MKLKFESCVKEILGENGINRLNIFSGYKFGWDRSNVRIGKRGKPMNIDSFNMMTYFLKHWRFENTPSVFMSRTGNLELIWDEDGERRYVDFYPYSFKFN